MLMMWWEEVKPKAVFDSIYLPSRHLAHVDSDIDHLMYQQPDKQDAQCKSSVKM